MRVFNTLTGQKEEFVPQGDVVRMYVCGVNPYSDAHIGHAMSYIFFDVVRRYLEFRGYRVRHIQNITDIEDNIIDAANRLGVSVEELTQKYTARYDEDMAALNVVAAHAYPRAMGETDKMIEVIRGLEDKGFAYAVGGDVYFRVRNVPDYGKLSGRTLDSMMAGARVEPGEDKEHPMDFLLWKAAKPGEPSWGSPWGEGRPGWHIECSAMALKYLGETLDIHGGGQDVVFPHHENEIAQSESFTGQKPFVRYWLHNGLLQLDQEKMSKSLGNLITIREALERYSADAVRIFILGSYYRSPLTFSYEALDAAAKGAERLLRAAAGRQPRPFGAKLVADAYRDRFIEAMDDDFGTAQALAALFDLARDINRADEAGMDTGDAQQTLRELGSEVLGLKFASRVSRDDSSTHDLANNLATWWESAKSIMESAHKISDEDVQQAASEVERTVGLLGNTLASISREVGGSQKGALELREATEANIQAWVDLRDHFRRAKQFQPADEIRDGLSNLGVPLEDGPEGTVWKHRRS